jgi:hypothetical protein
MICGQPKGNEYCLNVCFFRKKLSENHPYAISGCRSDRYAQCVYGWWKRRKYIFVEHKLRQVKCCDIGGKASHKRRVLGILDAEGKAVQLRGAPDEVLNTEESFGCDRLSDIV